MDRGNSTSVRQRCRWLMLSLMTTLLPLTVGSMLLTAMPAQGAKGEPPPPPPPLLSVQAGQSPTHDNRPIHTRITVGLLEDKPAGSALVNYCPPDQFVEAAPGEMLIFCYQMQNNSDTLFTRHTVVDSIFNIILENEYFPVSPTYTVQTVATIALSATLTNAMTWTAYAENGDSVSAFNSATVFVPTLEVTATVGQTPGACADSALLDLPDADEAIFCFRAHNPNPYPLVEHRAVDARGNLLPLPDNLILAPGETYTLTASVFVTEPVQHAVTWTARTATRQLPVTATASAAVRTPHVDVILASARAGGACRPGDLNAVAGGLVVFCYTAINDGSAVLNLHRVTDPALELDHSFPHTLTPDTAISIIFTRPVTATTLSTVTWYATLGDGRVVSDTAQGSVTIVPPGEITVAVLLTATDGAVGVPEIEIELDDPDEIRQTRTTNSSGEARFTDLVPGIYRAHVVTSSLGTQLSLISPNTITIDLAARSTASVTYALTGTLPLRLLHLPVISR
jgi:hypothetical protein